MRTICLIFILFIANASWSLSPEELHLKQEYYRLKSAKLDLKRKTDSVFLVLFNINISNPKLLDELSEDFLNYSLKQKNVYGKAYLAKTLSYTSGTNFKENIYNCKTSISFFKQEKDTISLCFAYQMLAGIYLHSTNYDLSIKYNLIAHRIAQKINNDVLMANSYNEIGLIMNIKQDYTRAKYYYFKALYHRKKCNEEFGIQTTYTNLGIVFKNMKQYDKAFYFQKKSLQLAQKMKSTFGIAYAYSDIGNLHLMLNQLDSAENYFKKSVALRKEIDDNWELGFTYNYLGELYRLKNNKQLSLSYLRDAVKLGQQTANSKQLYESFEQMSLTFAHFKQFDSAFVYNRKYEKLKDSINSRTHVLSVETLIADYEFERKQQEIELLRNQNMVQSLHINVQKDWLWISGLALVLLIGLVLFVIRNRQLRLAKIQLESQRKEELLRIEAQQRIQEDRVRISKELHDNIGANLTVFKELFSNQEQLENIEDIHLLTEETIQELRKSVWLLNQEESTFEEWIIRLKEYFRHLKKVRIQTEASETSNPSIPSRVLTELFRVIQEGVNNALKHASCSEILVNIQYEEATLYITISDNGIGITETNVSGFGLMNMKERISNLQGTIELNQKDQNGTIIRILIPIKS